MVGMKDNKDRIALAAAMENGTQDVEFHTSQFLRSLKCRLVSVTRGCVTLSFQPSDTYLQGHGVISGGITATMLDYAMAFASLTTCAKGESAVSVGLNVSYLAPVLPGLVHVEARLLSEGYRLAQAEAKLLGPNGQLWAMGNSPIALKRNS